MDSEKWEQFEKEYREWIEYKEQEWARIFARLDKVTEEIHLVNQRILGGK